MTEKRNPKEVMLSSFFLGHLLCEEAARFKGLEDNRMERTKRGIKREIKRCSKYVN